ncbi:MAG: aspartyl-tRNA(Asn)/glutamyl-tRNA(Gln) amidotransferase subunit, partial [Bryobacterales bacterium]|nr:aspartyl-tRNA(Asn)/glutamyl-tRNA(Gln) amidotransferase subunit [Bryobacterales bacterium]
IDTFNPKTNAWITVLREQALAQANALGKEQSSGHWRGPLHGIPIGLKDNIDAARVRTTAGSKTLAGNVATEDAEVTRRLRDAGAVLLGKCNMHIFAAGATSAVSYYGPVRNPWNLELIAGGSSGGSAAAVAMDNCYAALGTDTGGSIRTPSAMCGVTGLKATYGRVSIRGIVPLTWSRDHCGPIARTVEDTATVLKIIAGYDRLDLQSVDNPVVDHAAGIGAPVAQFRLGISPQFFDGLDADVARTVEEAIALLSRMTKGSKEIELPSLLGTGASSEGGVYREGLGSGFVRAEWDTADAVGVGAGAAAGGSGAVAGGGRVSSRAVDYIQEWRALRRLRRRVDDEVFRKQEADLIVTPTIRELPWTIEEELTRAASTRARNPKPGNTRALDDYGLPTISVPCGFSKSGLPIGLQISGANWRETDVLALAHAYQRATDWHTRRPLLTPDAKVPVLSKTASAQTGEAVTR